ncbi:MAG: FG-GAP-like repeat-containing protein, partial [Candidatus Thermoplasmatota archaeon]|nr:FG-GAP-like repeat-containing protein [Candidatus Thermoplasmatota archaeon]
MYRSYKKYIIIVLIVLVVLSTVHSIASKHDLPEVSPGVEQKYQVSFIEKSTGLNYPDKESGNTELELADINSDGYLDIISVGDHGSPFINSDQHGIMVWFGDGGNIWSVNQVGNFGYGGIEAGDINLDGNLDVVWGIHHDYSSEPGFGDTLIGAALGDGTGMNWIPWASGLGTGGETWGMFETDLADFNCNGYLDIVSQSFGCCNGYHIYQNNGDGTWTHRWSLTGGNTFANLETGDFNSDGYPDFAGNKDGSFVFFGDGSFNFTLSQNGLPTSSWYGLDVGDMNNNGGDDLVIGHGSNGVKCFTYNKQNNQWDLVSNGLPTSGQYYPQFGDINGDGFLDIVAYSPPTGYVYLGDGQGNWIADSSFTVPSPGSHSAFVVDGDFDHDGREDIVIQTRQGSWPSYKNHLRAFSPWLEPVTLFSLVQKPNGGETFRSGSTRKIRWLSAVPPSQQDSSVDIFLSRNGDPGPWNSIASDIPNNGCYQWLVDVSGSESCRIKIIVSTASSSSYDISLSDFTVIGFLVDVHGPYSASAYEPIQFNCTVENGTPPYEYLWYFGDGNTSSMQHPIHSYSDDGNYTVILSVTDSE